MGRRHRAREIALQVLYQIDMTGEEVEAALASRLGGRKLPGEVSRFAEQLVQGARLRRDELDRIVEESAENWRIDRMPVVDRNLLRMAAFELLFAGEAPPAVVIDEAIELAKRFGDEETAAFVNGVLDGIRRRIEGGEIPPAATA